MKQPAYSPQRHRVHRGGHFTQRHFTSKTQRHQRDRRGGRRQCRAAARPQWRLRRPQRTVARLGSRYHSRQSAIQAEARTLNPAASERSEAAFFRPLVYAQGLRHGVPCPAGKRRRSPRTHPFPRAPVFHLSSTWHAASLRRKGRPDLKAPEGPKAHPEKVGPEKQRRDEVMRAECPMSQGQGTRPVGDARCFALHRGSEHDNRGSQHYGIPPSAAWIRRVRGQEARLR